MKKKSLILMIVGVVLILVVGLGAFFNKPKEKINVYLFWGNGCGFCERAKQFFANMDSEYTKYYNLVENEVWYSEDNQKLMAKVANELGTEAKGVPFIVIGDEYFSGYAISMDDDIKETIVSQYNNEDYVDVVKKVK